MTDIQEKRISLAYEEYRLAIRKARMDYAMKLRALARRLETGADRSSSREGAEKMRKESMALLDLADRILGDMDGNMLPHPGGLDG